MVNDDGQLNILRTTPTELVIKTPKKRTLWKGFVAATYHLKSKYSLL